MSVKPEIDKTPGRIRWVTRLLVALFLLLAVRLFNLQVLRHEELAREARGNTIYDCGFEPRRGDVLDCKSNLLATTSYVKTVCANPALLAGHVKEVVPLLSPLLQMDPEELTLKLQPRYLLGKDRQILTNKVSLKPETNQYVMLKRKITPETWERIRACMTNIPIPGVDRVNEKTVPLAVRNSYNQIRQKAVFAAKFDEPVRVYPNASLAAHVLGYVGTADETNGTTPVIVLKGQDGIERRLDDKLRGVRGWRVSERDKQQREILEKRQQDVEARDGLNVVLTIDSYIQNVLETALQDGMKRFSPVSISGIVVRPKTGEILGMATYPTYDPNKPGDYPEESRRDRIVTDKHEPGSTFKIVVVSGALNDHLVNLDSEFDCKQGRFEYGGTVLRDHEPLGRIPVIQIITKSSNIGAAQIALMMHQQRLYHYVRAFGFGSPTGLLCGEVEGDVYPPEGLPADNKRKLKAGFGKWSALSITRIPMGHEISVTSIQMMMAMCAVANKGVLMEPMLVNRLISQDGTVAVQNHPKVAWRVIDEDAATQMVTALKSVVTTDGTAAAAAMTNYTVAGKTGTAQEVDENHRYSNEKYYSSFIGFFPADNPELCIYVSLDAPKGEHYGGKSAAPIFHAVAEKAANYLNIHPDKGNPTGIPEVPAPQAGSTLRTTAAILPRLMQQ
jgi:cell division protein FtsI/penicillin-binding protein 2